MTHSPTPDDVLAALDNCAAEPVHIPGLIQTPFAVIGVSMDDGQILYASENCAALFKMTIEEVFTQTAMNVLGSDFWHNVQNARSVGIAKTRRYDIGDVDIGGTAYGGSVFESGTILVIELEPHNNDDELTAETFRQQSFLIERIQNVETLPELFNLSTRLLCHISGFDRVMIYRFDPDWNGEVIAEDARSTLEPFKGLVFPSWDIPAQARAIMAQIPLRLISSVDEPPIPLIAASDDLPPLDLTLAEARGTSPVHMQYLRNMKSAATMTLSLVVSGKLWGLISFHNMTPKVANVSIRQILKSFLHVFRLKLEVLRDRETLILSQRVDALQADIQLLLEQDAELDKMMQNVGTTVCEVLDASGIVMVSGSQTASYGDVPSAAVMEQLVALARKTPGETTVINSLRDSLPDGFELPKNIAGALIAAPTEYRAIAVFRPAAASQVTWAGNPDKTIEISEGMARLEPRGSFSLYLERIEGQCKQWDAEDAYVLTQLWPLLSAAERRAFMNDVNRQQQLLIDELNHRVRNILALVKSVSQQTVLGQSSMEAYSTALEARIHALATAHGIGAGAARELASLRDIITQTTAPYQSKGQSRILIEGPDVSIQSDLAPLFGLIVHELATNAAKYGALTVKTGRAVVTINSTPKGVDVIWREIGGPPVSVPNLNGFGTTLIREAVPFEMGGVSTLDFNPSGLIATISLPSRIVRGNDDQVDTNGDVDELSVASEIPQHLKLGWVLIVEDNYMVAADLRAELEAMGLTKIDLASNAVRANELLEGEPPVFVVLDINLGRGRTSETIAQTLLNRGIPFIFVSGYGERTMLSPHLGDIPLLTKPVSKQQLKETLIAIAS